MRIVLYYFLGFTLFNIIISPPSLPAQQLLLGARIGASLSNLSVSSDPNKSFGNNSGFIAGTFSSNFHISIDDYIGLDMELNYMERGTKINQISTTQNAQGENLTIRTDAEYRLKYFDFPILLSLYLASEKKYRPKLYIGPNLSFMSGASWDSQTSIDSKQGLVGFYLDSKSVSDKFKVLDLGIILGGGINYQLTQRTWLTFDVRYLYGATNINADDNKPMVLNSRSLIGLVGVAYSLIKP